MNSLQEQITNLDAEFARYEQDISKQKFEIDAMPFEEYSAEYKEELRDEAYQKRKAEIDVILNRFETHIDELRNKVAASGFDGFAMIQEKKEFAAKHGISFADVEPMIKDFVATQDLETITNPRNPHHKLFMAYLARSGRQVEDSYNKELEEYKLEGKTSQKLDYIAERVAKFKQAGLKHAPLTSGSAYLAQLKASQG